MSNKKQIQKKRQPPQKRRFQDVILQLRKNQQFIHLDRQLESKLHMDLERPSRLKSHKVWV